MFAISHQPLQLQGNWMTFMCFSCSCTFMCNMKKTSYIKIGIIYPNLYCTSFPRLLLLEWVKSPRDALRASNTNTCASFIQIRWVGEMLDWDPARDQLRPGIHCSPSAPEHSASHQVMTGLSTGWWCNSNSEIADWTHRRRTLVQNWLKVHKMNLDSGGEENVRKFSIQLVFVVFYSRGRQIRVVQKRRTCRDCFTKI